MGKSKYKYTAGNRKGKYMALRNALFAIHGSAPERKIILYGTSCVGPTGEKLPIYISKNPKSNVNVRKRTLNGRTKLC